jgi:nitroimidazol reductase NimA-like FMN-containing flavoprotein (pyridoxamine 5'-phosphate oxidase superfamily)
MRSRCEAAKTSTIAVRFPIDHGLQVVDQPGECNSDENYKCVCVAGPMA